MVFLLLGKENEIQTDPGTIGWPVITYHFTGDAVGRRKPGEWMVFPAHFRRLGGFLFHSPYRTCQMLLGAGNKRQGHLFRHLFIPYQIPPHRAYVPKMLDTNPQTLRNPADTQELEPSFLSSVCGKPDGKYRPKYPDRYPPPGTSSAEPATGRPAPRNGPFRPNPSPYVRKASLSSGLEAKQTGASSFSRS